MESKVGVGQFYGIEIEEFPVRIAETAMYLIDHLENLALSDAFGQYYARFPIADTAHIVLGNALRMDWNSVLPAEQCNYVFGNPPFLGFVMRAEEQQEDLNLSLPAGFPRRVDYVLGWYAKSAVYGTGAPTRFAFVSTNSISQGEQVAGLWSYLLGAGFHIDFAHRTFEWTSEAKGRAHVHCVIVGFSAGGRAGDKWLFDYPNGLRGQPVERRARNINPYLVDGPDVVVIKARRPLLAWVPAMDIGSKPNDNGQLIVEPDQYNQVSQDPVAAKYLRRLIGSRELLHGEDRWCLWLTSATPAEIRSSEVLRTRLEAVRVHRLASRNAATRATALTPALFWSRSQPAVDYLAVPEISSERRRVVPMGFMPPSVIATNQIFTIAAADLLLFGLLQSGMYTAWVRTVGGRLKSDLRIAPSLTYNTFPFIERNSRRAAAIEQAAQEVLDARASYPDASMAELYDPLAMPLGLVNAHNDLDRAVESAYGRRRITSDTDRLAILFVRYATLLAEGQLQQADGHGRRRSGGHGGVGERL